MKIIKLVNNKGDILVDNEDYDYLNTFRWYLNKSKRLRVGYAQTVIQMNNKRIHLSLAHLLIGIPLNNNVIDHIDRNSLNNQKNNLRIVTHSQNMINKSNYKNSTSKFKGVSWDNSRQKWKVEISKNGKRINLGRFINEIDAAKAYNEKAKELHEEYAYLNEV